MTVSAAGAQNTPTIRAKFGSFTKNIAGRFQSRKAALTGKVKSCFVEFKHAGGAFLHSALNKPYQIVCTAGRYVSASANGALFGCGAGAASGATVGAIAGFTVGNIGSPIVGVPLAACGAVIGAGAGSMGGTACGGFLSGILHYRSEWKDVVQKQALEIQYLQAQLKAVQSN